jgi:hypothetical protein
MLENLRPSDECADFAHSRHVSSIPFDPELEVLVGIETSRIDDELCHKGFLLSLPCSRHGADETGRQQAQKYPALAE